MKRGAERQISKDDDADEEGDAHPPQGFQRAVESVLTKRPMRSLPKRAMASNNALSAPSPAGSEPPKFGGFAGFGAGAPSPFAFVPPASTPSATSIVAPLASASASHSSPPPALDDDYEAALKYYKSIRGLNVSFLSAIQKAVDQDPFVDIAGIFENYQNFRTTIQTDFDTTSKASRKAPASDSNPPPPASEKAAPSSMNGFSVPKGFSGFAGFSSTSSSAPSSNGITHGVAPKSSFAFPTAPSSTTITTPTFTLGAKPSEDAPASTSPVATSEPPKPTLSFGIKSDDAGSSKLTTFSFGTPPAPATTSKDKQDSTTSSPFAFGSTSAIPNFFASSKSFSSDASPKPTSVFGSTDSSKPFSPWSSDSVKKTPAKLEEDVKPANTPSPFGHSSFNPATSAFGSSSTTDKPTGSGFGMFGGGSPPKGNGFTFGKVGGSIGNPVGFGFGAPKPADGASEPLSSSPAAFSFGAPSTAHAKSVSPPMPSEESSRPGSQPAASEEGVQDEAKLLPTVNHDEEGEGEENETTTFAVRAKLFKLTKNADKNEWKEVGIGMFRLKRDKETGARRALMRNSATGRIIINFRLFASLSSTTVKATVSFVGHDEGAPASFRIRVKNPEQAQELKDALDRDVAAVKESS